MSSSSLASMTASQPPNQKQFLGVALSQSCWSLRVAMAQSINRRTTQSSHRAGASRQRILTMIARNSMGGVSPRRKGVGTAPKLSPWHLSDGYWGFARLRGVKFGGVWEDGACPIQGSLKFDWPDRHVASDKKSAGDSMMSLFRTLMISAALLGGAPVIAQVPDATVRVTATAPSGRPT